MKMHMYQKKYGENVSIYIYMYVYRYLEPGDVLDFGVKEPSKRRPFHSIQNKGHLGYRYMYIHKHAGWTQNTDILKEGWVLTSRCVPFDKSFESILYGQLRTEMLDTPHMSYDVMCINTIQNMTLVLFGSSTSTDHPIGLKQLKKVHESFLIKCALHAGMRWHNQLESARKSLVFCHFLPTHPPYPNKPPKKITSKSHPTF